MTLWTAELRFRPNGYGMFVPVARVYSQDSRQDALDRLAQQMAHDAAELQTLWLHYGYGEDLPVKALVRLLQAVEREPQAVVGLEPSQPPRLAVAVWQIQVPPSQKISPQALELALLHANPLRA